MSSNLIHFHLGGVAQLVRALACRIRGCGFESRYRRLILGDTRKNMRPLCDSDNRSAVPGQENVSKPVSW